MISFINMFGEFKTPRMAFTLDIRCRIYGREMSAKTPTHGRKDRQTISRSYFRQAVNSLCETMTLNFLNIKLLLGPNSVSLVYLSLNV